MSRQTEIIEQFGSLAKKLYRDRKVFASLTIAQLAWETGWLNYIPVDMYTGKYSFNPFGIKGAGTNGSVTCSTWEVYSTRSQVPKGAWNIKQRPDGKWRCIIEAQFAAYNDFYEALVEHAEFLVINPRYAPVLAAKDGIEAAKQILICGYATDPNYSNGLISIINTYGLQAYDVLEEEDEMDKPMQIPDWKWRQYYAYIGDAYNKGLIEDWGWCQKVVDKTLTYADLLFIQIIISGKEKGLSMSSETVIPAWDNK